MDLSYMQMRRRAAKGAWRRALAAKARAVFSSAAVETAVALGLVAAAIIVAVLFDAAATAGVEQLAIMAGKP